MRWLELRWVLPVVIGLGCGNTVTDDATGNGGGTGASTANGGSGGTGAASGGGGSGGSTVTTTSIGTTGTTTTSSSSSTTTTTTTIAGTPCEQACAEAGMCGLPADMCGQFLDCNTTQGTCAATCINDPAIGCTEIFLAVQNQSGPLIDCLLECQGGQGGAGGMGQGGMGQGGMGQGGGSAADCQQCGQDSCTNAFFQCGQVAGFGACQGWLQCAQGCMDQPCLDACTAMVPAAQVIQDCLCTSCANDCSAVCSGSSGAGGMGQGGGMPMCEDCQTLAFSGGNNPCMGSDVLFQDVRDCICTTACAAQCGNDCQNPDLNLQNVSPACSQCAGGAIGNACSAEWQACSGDPN